VVVSFVPGRIRLRFRELKNSAVSESAKSRIGETPGVTKVEANPVTGSILIEYDTKILPTEKLAEEGRRELAKLGVTLDLHDLPS
jgi:copper chaperone CopZ